MTKTGLIIIRIIGWVYSIFLGISYAYFKDDLSFITTDMPSAFIFFMIGLFLIIYDFGYSKNN
ncbi:hypothetical protein CYL18_12985 [Pradoshia eiseniae]|uniref:Uncharacterized protein n=1 Tax=Pradoshia eiseniae TaxID=2064768 RepID=A0A2S7MXS7_9BACI|nr:hypothetical protein CYL18_12985 [Pradoshia eiseniae]